MRYYSTVQEVRNYTGTKYDDLALNSDTDLNTLIENYLKQIKSLIDRDRGRDLIRDLDFGDKLMLVNAEKPWTGKKCSVAIVEKDIDEIDIVPSGIFAVNQFTLQTTVANDIIAYSVIDEDLSKAKTLDMDIMSYDLDLERGDLQIVLSDDITCTNIVKAIDLPLIYEYEWKKVRGYLGTDDTLNSVKSVGIRMANNVGSYLYVGNVYTRVIPEGIHNIAMRACANMIKLAYANRESPVITIENMNAQLIKDQVLTTELRRELSLYKKKANFGFSIVAGKDMDLEDYV
jgi:hypothetical protein